MFIGTDNNEPIEKHVLLRHSLASSEPSLLSYILPRRYFETWYFDQTFNSINIELYESDTMLDLGDTIMDKRHIVSALAELTNSTKLYKLALFNERSFA